MWQSRPVFISSTFADMQAERDYLRTRVFPELEERLRARRNYLAWVDLRVGVAIGAGADEGAREAAVLKHCLAEVKRCRPFLIVLLGDRYGWVPPADRLVDAGFGPEAAGRSVTDLEIELGVLADPAQQPRSLFYFREPLPYADMAADVAALYCEDYAPDVARAERKERLAALKRRVETRQAGRMVPYRVAWDGERQRVTGLEDFGQMVLEDLWAELAEETAQPPPEISWQEAEQNALQDFIDALARDFVGRQAIMARLSSLCLAPAVDGTLWGVCITGDPGSGKSALFGALYRRLGESDVFLLAHASGASVAAASVDSMLRRWIGELAGALGTDPGLAENADADMIDAAFARLLGQMAEQRRVVVLVDALDQFETTTRAQYATWLPQLWPANALLIATAIAGEASKAVAERPGIEPLLLSPLDAAEARDIIEGVCKRYGRSFDPKVIEALLAKRSAGAPAWGNPLWLVLAVEELNLLDADDFARAQHSYSGHLTERLRDLMVDEIAEFPPDVSGLYDHTFARAEKLFGENLTRAFLGLVAVSRAGWRESDFRILLPRTSGENWNELKFAQLRRIFRGQMRQRGALEQWDFNHAQMRAAVRTRLAALHVSEQSLHTVIANRLLSASPDDPLHISETMVHLLASEDYAQAARYYGNRSLSEAEAQSAMRVLADGILTASGVEAEVAARRVCRLLVVYGIDDSIRIVVANHFAFHLCDAIARQASLSQRAMIADSVTHTFETLLRHDPESADRQRGLSVSYTRTGDVQFARGDLAAAFKSYRAGLAIAECLAHSDRGNVWWQNDLAASHERVGDLLIQQGDLAGAMTAYRESLAIAERLAGSAPANSDWQRGLLTSRDRIGRVLVKQGDLAGALNSHRDGLAIAEQLAHNDPTNTQWQSDLAAAHHGIGYVQVQQGELDGALKSYRDSLAIANKLAGADPGDAQRQFDLSLLSERIGDVLLKQGDVSGAQKFYRESLAIRERLTQSDPANAYWQRNLSVAYNRIGEVLAAQGDLAGALRFYRDVLAARVQRAQSDPGNAQWQHDVAASHERIAGAQEVQGDLIGALISYRDCLAISQQLARADPTNTQWQRELAVSHWKLASIYLRRRSIEAAKVELLKGRQIMAALVAMAPNHSGWKKQLSEFNELISLLTTANR